ncbi:MAG: NAD(P)-dependent alcohol dehydrogenase [Planctomycetota bacterium]
MRGLVVADGGLTLSESLPEPIAGTGQALVEVRAAGLNPTDADIASGAIDDLLDPRLRSSKVRTGLEFAGVVVGGGGSLQVGQSVFGYPEVVGPQKAHQELLAVDEESVAPMPANVEFDAAASLPLAAVTVVVLHRDVAPVEPRARVLVIGAAGGVGLVHMQAAKNVYGAEVTAIAGPGNEAFLASMGADRFVDYRQTRVGDLTDRFDVIVDWTTKYRFAEVEHLLAADGRFVPADPFKNADDLRAGSESAERTGRLFAACGTRAELDVVREWVESRRLRPVVDRVFDLDDHARALERLGTRAKRGRVVLRVASG